MATIEVQKFTFNAVKISATRQEYIKTGEKLTFNKDTGTYTATVTAAVTGKEYIGIGISNNEAGAQQVAEDDLLAKIAETDSGTITVSSYGDGVFIRDDRYFAPQFTLESATQTAQSNTIFGIFNAAGDLFVQAQNPPPSPPPPAKPVPEASDVKGVYYPKTRYTEPKSAAPGEFVVKSTQETYKGTYVETFDSKYYGGTSPLDTGVELEKVKESQAGLDEGRPDYFGVLAELGGSVLKRLLTKGEKSKGVAKRYFVQDKNNNKIVETDRANFLQTQQQVMSRRFAEVDWIVKGPAEDKMFGKYKYEGAESKNRKTIQDLEKQIPGISTYITDYRYLVEEPVRASQQLLTRETIVERGEDVTLENSRKASFDTRK
jgi:hypothetical protein